MYTYGVQPSRIQLEDGFSTDNSINLSNKNFRTGLKTSNSAQLTNVTAPYIVSGASCKLTACKIDEVRADSYLEAQNSTFQTVKSDSSAKLLNCTATSIKSNSYLEITQVTAKNVKSSSSCKINNCPNVLTVFSESYLEASNSKLGDVKSESSMKITQCNVTSAKSDSYFEGTASIIETIESSSSAKLTNMQGVKSLISNSYVEAKDSTIEKIKAEGTVKAENSEVNDLTAGRLVSLNATSVNGELKAASLVARGGKLVSVSLEGKADLASCSVIEKVFANTINGTSCKVLGELNAKSDVTIKDSEEIGSIVARKATIINSKVLGDLHAINLKLTNTRVGGVVTSANQELVLNNCHLPKLILKKPQACVELSTVQIHEIFQRRTVPQDIRQMVEYILLDKAKIEIIDDKYKITIGDSCFTINANSYAHGNQFVQTYNTGNVQFMNNFSNMFGSVNIGGMGSVSINGMSISSSGKGIKISGGKITGGDGEEYPMEILNNPLKILQARNMAIQIKEDVEIEKKRLEELKPSPQVVIVCGGHVEEICFETEGGIVLYERGGTVGKITNLQGEEYKLEKIIEDSKQENVKVAKEPPEEFLSPISLEVMNDPYKTPLGHYFDKRDIIDIMAHNKGTFKCPLTRREFKWEELKRDDKFRDQIEEWLKLYIAI